MFRNLYADTRNIILCRAFRIALGVIAVYQIFHFIIFKALYVFFLKTTMDADTVAFTFPSIAAFLVTAVKQC